MACEKYSGWITGAALGMLGAAEDAELRAHATGCGDCRGEWNRMRALVAAVDRAVEATVAGEPPAEFAARLRARIAEEPEPSAWLFFPWPRIAAATLAVAAALFAVILLRAPERGEQPARVAARTPAAIAPPSRPQIAATPERARVSMPVALQRTASRGRSPAGSFSMEVLVPKGQLSAALALCEAVNSGSIDGVQLSQLAEHTAEPLAMKALFIAPLDSPSAQTADEAAAPDGGRD